MAISKIKLPDNSTQDIHDSRVLGVDSTPTANSSNLVTSGGVYQALQGAGAVQDVTVGGTSVVANKVAVIPAIPEAVVAQELSIDSTPTANSANLVTSGGVYSALADKANVVTVGSSMPSGGFLPNVYYSLGTVSGSVTWSLASSSSAADEYMLEFTAASTAPTITWPSGITWFGGSAPSLTGGKTYQVSIQNNLAVCAEF